MPEGTKPRRNQLCPCGSSKKYKHCHGAINAGGPAALPQRPSDEWIRQTLARHEAENRQREQQQGLGRPGIISFESNGYRIVCVGNRVFRSLKWKTFHDFLHDYPAMLFGEPWMAKQRKKHRQSSIPIFNGCVERSMIIGGSELRVQVQSGLVRSQRQSRR